MSLQERFHQEIVPGLMKTLNIKNIMAVPKVEKVVINIGIPKTDTSTADLEAAAKDLGLITGQKARYTQAKKSIAGFKIRTGDPVGVSVTLRGRLMFDFLEKLCRIVLPQVKDFKGVKATAFDGRGNYTLGLSEQIIFPEIDYAKVDKIRGMEIVIVTTAKTNEEGRALLESIGMPFEKESVTK